MQTALALPLTGPVPTPVAPPPIARLKAPPPKAGTDKDPVALAGPAPLLLFGFDQRGRSHAACFVGHEAAAVERAADLMDLYVVAAETKVLRDLGAELTIGRLFPVSGKAFVPFVKADLFNRLLVAAGLPDAPMPAQAAAKPASAPPTPKSSDGRPDAPGGAGGASKPPFDWDEISINSLVLATTGGPQEGWFEAVVVYTKADNFFELRWRDFPLDSNVVRHRNELALLHPGTATKGGEA